MLPEDRTGSHPACGHEQRPVTLGRLTAIRDHLCHNQPIDEPVLNLELLTVFLLAEDQMRTAVHGYTEGRQRAHELLDKDFDRLYEAGRALLYGETNEVGH